MHYQNQTNTVDGYRPNTSVGLQVSGALHPNGSTNPSLRPNHVFGEFGELIHVARPCFSAFSALWIRLIVTCVISALIALGAILIGAPIFLLILMWPIWILVKLLVLSLSIKYSIYEHIIIIEYGFLKPRTETIWFWQIRKVEWSYDTLKDRMTGSKTVTLWVEGPDIHHGTSTKTVPIYALPPIVKSWRVRTFMQRLYEELLRASLGQRYDMKKQLTL